MWPDVEITSSPIFAKSSPKSGNCSLYLTKIYSKWSKSNQMFGLLLFENILPGTIKIAQSGHTGIDREQFWAELNPLRYVDEWKLDLWITVWPDLAKFRHCGKKLSLWQFFKGIFSIWRHLELIMTIFYGIRQIFIAINGEILNNYFGHLITLYLWYSIHT